MKAHPLAIITLILASSSVQAHTGSESTMNPKADLDPTAILAVPVEMMAQMMVIPMKMMQEMMAVPLKMIEEMMAAPKNNMYTAATMKPMTLPQQTPEANSGAPAYGTPAAAAQAEPPPQAAPAL